MSLQAKEKHFASDVLRTEHLFADHLVGWLHIQDIPPRIHDRVRLGTLWLDTATGKLFRVSSLDPLTFVEIGGSVVGAPINAEYLVGVADPTLTAERVVTDTPTVTWDLATPGQAKANVPDNAITFAKLQDIAANRILGRITAGSGDVEELTGTQVTTLLDVFTSTLKGLVPASGGGTTNFLRADGTFAAPPGAGSAFTGVTLQAFTTPGANTYTPTAGMKFCIVISTGGGGGGGGSDTDGTTGSVGAGAGGGAGGTCIEAFSAATIGASQTVTIGAAGTAGVPGGNGGSGGNTTFGALHTAAGGQGGLGSGISALDFIAIAGGVGGTATGGLINIPGGPGGSAIAGGVDGTTDLSFALGGDGAASFWGGGGQGGVTANATTTTDANNSGLISGVYGSGGGGGATLNATDGAAGRAGVAGVCLIIEFT